MYNQLAVAGVGTLFKNLLWGLAEMRTMVHAQPLTKDEVSTFLDSAVDGRHMWAYEFSRLNTVIGASWDGSNTSVIPQGTSI